MYNILEIHPLKGMQQIKKQVVFSAVRKISTLPQAAS
jgi:hypothetical protein